MQDLRWTMLNTELTLCYLDFIALAKHAIYLIIDLIVGLGLIVIIPVWNLKSMNLPQPMFPSSLEAMGQSEASFVSQAWTHRIGLTLNRHLRKCRGISHIRVSKEGNRSQVRFGHGGFGIRME